jgi:hypothetical protein
MDWDFDYLEISETPADLFDMSASDWEVGTWFGYQLHSRHEALAFRADWSELTPTERVQIRQEVGWELEAHIAKQILRRNAK